MARPRTLKRRRYWYLRDRHFSPKEAREFSKLSQRYPALRQMVATRAKQWASFKRTVKEREWQSNYKVSSEWRSRLEQFYSRHGWMAKFVTTKKGKRIISPWEWYDAVFHDLPDELKWDTPRSHRVSQSDVLDMGKIHEQRLKAQKKKKRRR